MMRWRIEMAALVLSASLMSCAFEDGQPWGKADFEFQASFDPASRRTEVGLKTAKDYAVQVDRFALRFGTLRLALRPVGASANFDPADPPPGFSLCHNGHCHADSGALVPYDEIRLDLASSSATASSVTAALDATLSLKEEEPATLTPEDCSGECLLDRGELSTLTLSVGALEFQGRVFDLRPPDARRLPDDGVPLSGTLPLDLNFEQVLEGSVDDSELPGVRVSVTLTVRASLFDAIDFASFTTDGEAIDLDTAPEMQTLVADALRHHSEFTVGISRFELGDTQ